MHDRARAIRDSQPGYVADFCFRLQLIRSPAIFYHAIHNQAITYRSSLPQPIRPPQCTPGPAESRHSSSLGPSRQCRLILARRPTRLQNSQIRRKECWEKTLEPCLEADFFLQPRMQKHQFPGRLAGQRLQHRPCKQFEGHHGRNRIPWQAEEISGRFSRASAPAPTFSEHDRSPGLDFGSGEEELGVHFCQRLLDQIVATHGDAAGQEKQI